jgi:hypothetical protein
MRGGHNVVAVGSQAGGTGKRRKRAGQSRIQARDRSQRQARGTGRGGKDIEGMKWDGGREGKKSPDERQVVKVGAVEQDLGARSQGRHSRSNGWKYEKV